MTEKAMSIKQWHAQHIKNAVFEGFLAGLIVGCIIGLVVTLFYLQDQSIVKAARASAAQYQLP